MRATEFIIESLDSKIPYKVVTATDNVFTTRAEIGGRTVEFGGAIEGGDGMWEVAFLELDEKGRPFFNKTGSGSELQVFSFVLNSLKELVAKYHPVEIKFTSDKSDENRTGLYTKLVKRFPIPGYKFQGVVDMHNKDKFIIKRIDNIDEEVLDEMPLPADWEPSVYGPGTTFKQRLTYALNRAAKLGVGSSRVATTIDYEGRPTVLKIAKNQKGLAQNSVEASILEDGYASQLGILIPLIDYDTQNREPTWIHTEMATKASEKQLCNLLKCPSLSFLVNYASSITGKKRYMGLPQGYQEKLQTSGMSDDDIETCTDYANTLADLNSNFDVELGDFTRAANWGIYQGKPIIVDVGFNSNVLNQYYKR